MAVCQLKLLMCDHNAYNTLLPIQLDF